ncbi:RES family NAD+ phosphorylase [Microbaculum marinisediminis]|uniref:RES family NAD+ phosphorylase n=1 Tax=Microbaculum marinisediminis TaxID=2931392 RepID=A0AAW5QYV1_9HYPH|nr:RES family NAD+ phosphorylase [Microbaculum sp. A6E488]MCT8971578.1 RES family NAD+ phosphorylase [Microbaculum sp. A6E488]
MSSPISTPAALSSETRPLGGACWRLVEAQHYVSTMKLVDTLEEQELLENLIEDTKPAIPVPCRHLHYLLASPFRYGAPYPVGSRFRRAGMTEGVYYAAEQQETAIAETIFHRLLFFADSPDTPWPQTPGEFTAFSANFATATGLDLMDGPLAAHRARWTDPTDYGPCQDLADRARAAGVEAIRYESVRDPRSGANLALLACTAFTVAAPVDQITWKIHLGTAGAWAVSASLQQKIEYARDAFSADPRIEALDWDR